MSETTPELAPSNTSRFLRGVRLGTPVFLGYMPLGMAFGLMAVAAGFTIAQATACSALAIAGAGQYLAIRMIAAGGLATTLIATGVVNLRYLLFSATMAPHVSGVPRWQQGLLAFTLTDETFAINAADAREGRADRFSMLGVGAVSWVGWTLGTLIGSLAGSAIGDPNAWGVGFALPAMFTALLVGQLTGKREYVAAGLAAAAALALSLFVPRDWALVAAAVIAATVMTVVK
ncbi:MAG TPA: AzlC family ABC transporter permease [Coriobacteriia bacterium]